MKKLFWIFLAILTTGCQIKGGDPVVTTTGKVPSVSKRSVTLTWNASSGVVQGYKVEGSLDGANFLELGIVDGTANGVVITLTTGATYYFRVRGFNQGGNSPYTAVSSIAL